MSQLRLAKLELFSTATMFPAASPKQRNLGGAIFLVAIDDYCSLQEGVHEGAKNFLFPCTPQWQEHFDWVASLTVGLDAKWLRESLDRARAGWDRQRAAGTRTRKKPSLMRRKACDLTRGRGSDGLVAEQPVAAGGARDQVAAPQL